MKRTVVCHDIDGEEIEVDVDKLQFRPSVYGILIENGKVLLSKQWDGYDFPGGGVELYETLEQALKREFIEETGLEIKIGEPVHCGSSFFVPKYSKKSKGQYWNCPLIYFLVERVGGELSIEQCDEDEKRYIDFPEWIDIEKIKDLKFYNGIDSEKVIKKALKITNNQ
jgi:8-oxo-dGTP pyrophosphatase MutT (NUDIX family)